MKKNYIRFNESINISLKKIMTTKKNTFYFGLGADDSSRVFNTTNNLKELFGNYRVFDTPLSENSMTGIAVGMSINDQIPIMSHQRLDFFLLAMDQLVNSAAKWNFMFGKQKTVNMVIRLIVGRGWGQGPTHSQNLQSWFAHIPGLKVMAPSFPSTCSGILEQAIKDRNPTIIIENRWCHQIKESIKSYKKNIKKIRYGKSFKLNSGSDITIVTSSYSTIEMYKCYTELKTSNISFDHIDLLSIKPLDINTIFESVKKTGKILILDNSTHKICSVASEIISSLIDLNHKILKKKPEILTLPDIHQPTSHYLTKEYFISKDRLLSSISKLVDKSIKIEKTIETINHDIVNDKEIFNF